MQLNGKTYQINLLFWKDSVAIVLMLLITGCNPLVGVGSLIHSLATGNTVGIVTGGAGVAVEHTTGKSPTEHILDKFNKHKKEDPQMGKRIDWITPK